MRLPGETVRDALLKHLPRRVSTSKCPKNKNPRVAPLQPVSICIIPYARMVHLVVIKALFLLSYFQFYFGMSFFLSFGLHRGALAFAFFFLRGHT